jgi:DNA-binding NarL/FixJ family response regulator
MTAQRKLISVIIADDHEIFRDGLKLILTPKNGIQLIGEAANGKILVALARELQPDVVITDIKMPEMDGLAATRTLTVTQPGINIISLSMFGEEDLVVDMFEAGARGYLLKNAHKDEILEAIETVNKGNAYFCETATRRLTTKLGFSKFNPFKDNERPLLTERETEMLQLICQECTNKEMSEKMGISIRTVEGTRQRIIEKMNVKNTAGMVIFAMKMGLYWPDK